MKSYVRMKLREIWSVKMVVKELWRVEELKRSIEEGKSEEKADIEQNIVSIVARYEDVDEKKDVVEEYRLDKDYRVDNVAFPEVRR